MMRIRPIEERDWDALWDLAHKTGPGFTSLQPDEPRVRRKLQWALESIAADPPLREALYLFVLEDTASGAIAGISGIESAVGLSEPWYNYHVSTLVHASRRLGVYNQIQTLTLANDHTGCSEVCTLFLDPDYRKNRNGALLSKSRFMFMAEFPDRFAETVIAEMRGYSDENGVSPFWEGLGRHFFSIDFAEADQRSGEDKVFIAELMPRHPVYTNLLPESARAAIGKTHKNTTPARKLLESEGFRYTGYVDIFDAGPVLETQVQDIRVVRDSRYFKALKGDDADREGDLFMVSNTRLAGFRCVLTPLVPRGNIASLSEEVLEALEIKAGDPVRVVPLAAERSF